MTYELDESTGQSIAVFWPKSDADHLCNSDQRCEVLAPGSVCGSTFRDKGVDPFEVDGVYENERIFYGIAGFDDFWQALLTVFQVCTLEGWSNLMFAYVDSSDYPYTAYIFFPLTVAIGAHFTLNLILAQIIDSYYY